MITKTDIIVIGGGSIGLHSAYYLLKSGRSVTILDQAAIGKGSSSGNAGQIVPSHIVPLAAPGVVYTALKWMLNPDNSPFGLKISLDPVYLSWLAQFAASCSEKNVALGIPPLKALGLLSAHNFAEIISTEKFDCSYQEAGVVLLYKTQAGFDDGKREAGLLQENGMPVEVLTQEAIREREPLALADVIGGVHLTGDASLNPDRYLRLLRDRARELGADLRENTPVEGFVTAGGKIARVLTRHEEFEPALVVLAAGAWMPRLARDLDLRISIQPARGYSLTMSAPTTMPRQAALLGERKIAVTPMGDLLRFTGRLEIGNMSTTPNPRWIAAIERAVREYIHLDETLDIRETWAGLRPVTPDGMPIIGFSPKQENLLLAAGHAMLGLSLGPGTGQIISELANQAKPAFDPITFRYR